jgi:hypothetical protein
MATNFTAKSHNDNFLEEWNGSLAHSDLTQRRASVTMWLESHQFLCWVGFILIIRLVVNRFAKVDVAGCNLWFKVAFCKSSKFAKQLFLFIFSLLHGLSCTIFCVLFFGQFAGGPQRFFLAFNLSLINVVPHGNEVLCFPHIADLLEVWVIRSNDLCRNVAISRGVSQL